MSKKETNPFFTSLEENIRASSTRALVRSVVANPDQTIGNILESLGEQEEAKYLLEAFQEMSIGQIVQGAVEFSQSVGPVSQEPVQVRHAEHRPAPIKASTPGKPKVKKAAPLRAGDSGPEPVDLSTPDKVKAYESSILKAFKEGKHVDEESGISSSNLRKVVGGTTDQARGVLDELIHNERVAFYGKARGTKYYRL